MRREEALGLCPGELVLCPAEGEEATRTCIIVSVGGETQEDLFGDPFVWVTVRDTLRGGTALIPSNHVSRENGSASRDQGQGSVRVETRNPT